MFRTLVFGAPLGGVALYFSGFLSADYSRVVDRTPSEVAEALRYMEFDPAAGAPNNASDMMRFTQTPNELVWSVMSGQQVATNMVVDLEPLENGTKTKVTAHVDRGNASDDKITPVFRSEGMTLTLLVTSVENRLDRLTASAMNVDKCREIMENASQTHIDQIEQRRPSGLGDAIGMHAEQTVRLNSFVGELKRNGCNVGFKDTPPTPPVEMVGPGQPPADANINFTPGQPMISTTPPNKPRL